MIIGKNKKEVIENIRKNIEECEFNKKGNIEDPNLSKEEINKFLDSFYANKQKKSYALKHKIADIIVSQVGKKIYKDIEVEGLENIKDLDLSHGAIITSNHFNELDSYNMRAVAKATSKKLYIVIEDTNLALPGKLGFLMNNIDAIPINKSPNYIIKIFKRELKRVLDEGNLVLIYPEEEMWFNYRLPRPCKRGAYLFASELNVPIISCFVELIDTKITDTEEFNIVKNKVHVLEPLIVNPNKSARENSFILCKKDYEQKVVAYEKAYHQKLDYTFSYDDFAGYKVYSKK